jgi:hypothetical protein
MDRGRIRRTLWAPLDPAWDSDTIGRFVFGPPTPAHLLAGLLIGLLIAILFVVVG